MSDSNYSLYRQQYPDPFLDQASTKLPKSQQKLFEMLHIFATTHPQIRPIVHKLAKYPITHLIINSRRTGDFHEFERKWKDILEFDLDVYQIAEGMGLDFFGYGNSFITIHKPFERTYECKICSEHNTKDIEFFINGKNIVGTCSACKKRTSFNPKDNYLTDPSKITIVRIPPREMHIKKNTSSGAVEYYRSVPPELVNAVKNTTRPDRFIINTTPWKYVEAALSGSKKTKIKYAQGKVLHSMEETLSSHNSHWGQPIIMAGLKDAYLNQIYKKADETVANERTVPARFIYPQATSQSPMQTIGLGRWSRYMTRIMNIRRHDKNAIMPVPFPVGVAEIGGDAQRLVTSNLRELLINEIIGSTGVPQGFLSDGMTYSGGTVQARMLENMIGSYLRAQHRLLYFIVKEVSNITGIEPVDVKWKPFKKADDVQMLQILLQLVQMKLVSGKEILDRIDLDFEEQNGIISRETEKIQEIRVLESLVEVKSMLRGVDYQVKAQARQGSSQEMLEAINNSAQELVTGASKSKVDSIPEDPEDKTSPIVNSLVQKLQGMDPESAQEFLERLKNNPTSQGIYRMVAAKMSHLVADMAEDPEDLARQIIMLPNKMRAETFQRLQEENPQLAASVMRIMHGQMKAGRGDNTINKVKIDNERSKG